MLSVHHTSTAVFNAVLSANGGRQPGYGASEPDDEVNMSLVLGLLARFQQRDWSKADA